MSARADNLRGALPRRPPLERLADDRVRLWAPAKINLDLLVGPRRTDGYHRLDSLVAKVTLYDRLEVGICERPGTELTCEGFDCGPAERNLAVRAAEALGERFGRRGVTIELAKAIPPGCGLGGGSSDAAAVLRGLNELWRLGLGERELAGVGADLGSDVPLFFGPPTLRMTGGGEQFEQTPVHPFVAVLVLTPLACSTAEVYRAYDDAPSAIDRQLEAERIAGQPPSAWREQLANDLAGPARRCCPPLAELQDRLAVQIDAPVHITGSGSGLFVLCDDPAAAGAVAETISAATQADAGVNIVVVESVG